MSKSMPMDTVCTTRAFISIAISVTCLKVLLIPSYFSTDFDVHRNWLAITSSLPISKWYIEKTSEWTLDYPPLFAWFEWTLSLFAPIFDHKMLTISAKPYFSHGTLYFQRLTVIVSDVVYYYSVYKLVNVGQKMNLGHLNNRFRERFLEFLPSGHADPWFDPRVVMTILFLLNPGLLLVDHIHFQYNGFLSGVFILSIVSMLDGQVVQASFWFSILINLKHIYLYVAPVYFVYILRHYCLDRHYNVQLKTFIKVSSVVISVFMVSLGPFIAVGSFGHLLGRLFPFQRGLTHVYWAPNFWALYNFADKILATVLRIKPPNIPSTTSGIVQDVHHVVLPKITPLLTLALVVMSMTPALIHLWKRCHFSINVSIIFLRVLVLASFCSFMFGFHVHEKAILVVLIPMTPLAMVSASDAKIYLLLIVTGTYSLFPLLFQSGEAMTKILILGLFLSYSFPALNYLHGQGQTRGQVLEQDRNFELEVSKKIKSIFQDHFKLFNVYETIYILGFIALHVYCSMIHGQILGLGHKLPFLPLMLTSVYCAHGVLYSFFKFYMLTLNCV